MRYLLGSLAMLAIVSAAFASDRPFAIVGKVYVDLNCNGIRDANDPPINGVQVQLIKQNGVVIAETGAFGILGQYGFPSDGALVGPSSNVNETLVVILPAGFNASAAIPGEYAVVVDKASQRYNIPSSVVDQRTLAGTDMGPNGPTFRGYDFLICRTKGWVTFTQGGWGSVPHGRNPGKLLADNFSKVYPNGVEIGATDQTLCPGFNLKFTSALAVRGFLPQGGTPSSITKSEVNPSKKLTVFAGQVLALRLSVDFSNSGVTTGLLGQLKLTSGALKGWTIAQVLRLAEDVLGGCLAKMPQGLTISGLNDIVSKINENFDGGTTNKNYAAP